MDSIEQLTSLLERFPGVGPRQAERFVQFILRSSQTFRSELIDSMKKLGDTVHQCSTCYRFFSEPAHVGHVGAHVKSCGICTSPKRDRSTLLVIATDADLAALEKSGTYRGLYFIFGGTVSLASEETKHLRAKELLRSISGRVKERLTEVILAFPANPEGDATTARVREALVTASQGKPFKISTLGRGLSTGSELEYADPDTIKNALDARK